KTILNTNGDVYSKFTSFWNKAKTLVVKKPIKNKYNNYYKKNIPFIFTDLDSLYFYNEYVPENGGCISVLKKLKELKNFTNYNNTRNILHINTTRLSAYLKFGCVSIRKLYYRII